MPQAARGQIMAVHSSFCRRTGAAKPALKVEGPWWKRLLPWQTADAEYERLDTTDSAGEKQDPGPGVVRSWLHICWLHRMRALFSLVVRFCKPIPLCWSPTLLRASGQRYDESYTYVQAACPSTHVHARHSDCLTQLCSMQQRAPIWRRTDRTTRLPSACAACARATAKYRFVRDFQLTVQTACHSDPGRVVLTPDQCLWLLPELKARIHEPRNDVMSFQHLGPLGLGGRTKQSC